MGYDSQQTSEPEDPARPDNLWMPVSGDHGAHGRFDARAQPVSMQVWAAQHRHELTMVVSIAALALGLMTRALDRSAA
jgi:hypothetical protein